MAETIGRSISPEGRPVRASPPSLRAGNGQRLLVDPNKNAQSKCTTNTWRKTRKKVLRYIEGKETCGWVRRKNCTANELRRHQLSHGKSRCVRAVRYSATVGRRSVGGPLSCALPWVLPPFSRPKEGRVVDVCLDIFSTSNMVEEGVHNEKSVGDRAAFFQTELEESVPGHDLRSAV